MKTIKGDLIKLAKEGKYDIIIHGCNCFHTMGGGIARQIRKEFPEAYQKDLETKKGDKEKLGNYTFVVLDNYQHLIIVNAYTQYNYGVGKQVDYDAVKSCFQKIKCMFGESKIRFGIPKIGAGLAGGDWNIISEIIEKEMIGEDIEVVEYYDKGE